MQGEIRKPHNKFSHSQNTRLQNEKRGILTDTSKKTLLFNVFKRYQILHSSVFLLCKIGLVIGIMKFL